MFRQIRTIRTLRKTLGNVTQKAPDVSVQTLRDQLPDMSPEDREYVQSLLKSHPKQVKQALAEAGKMQQPTNLKDLLQSLMAEAESFEELDTMFWENVQLLIKQSKGYKNYGKRLDDVPLYVNLFEAAKHLPEPQRSRMLYRIGRHVYQLKAVRFDPINEVEFLDTLAKNGKPFEAASYWKSRKDRDEVKDTIYWYEVGIMYHLQCGLFSKANDIAQEMLQKFDYVPPVVACELIIAQQDPKLWIQYLSFFDRPASDSDILQRIMPVDMQDITRTVVSLALSNRWDLGFELLVEFAGKEFSGDQIGLLDKQVKYHEPSGDLSSFCGAFVNAWPQILTFNSFYYYWITRLIDQKDFKEVKEILSIMELESIRFSDAQISKILEALLQHGQLELSLKLNSLYDIPSAAIVMINYYAERDPTKLQSYVDSVNCELSPALAGKLIDLGMSEFPLLTLGLDHQCWKKIWSRIRSHATDVSPREAFEAMISANNYENSLNLFEAILHAFVIRDDRQGAAAVLYYMHEHHNLPPNRLLLASVANLVKSLKEGRPIKYASNPKGDIPWIVDSSSAENGDARRLEWLTNPELPDSGAAILGTDPPAAKELACQWLHTTKANDPST